MKKKRSSSLKIGLFLKTNHLQKDSFFYLHLDLFVNKEMKTMLYLLHFCRLNSLLYSNTTGKKIKTGTISRLKIFLKIKEVWVLKSDIQGR